MATKNGSVHPSFTEIRTPQYSRQCGKTEKIKHNTLPTSWLRWKKRVFLDSLNRRSCKLIGIYPDGKDRATYVVWFATVSIVVLGWVRGSTNSSKRSNSNKRNWQASTMVVADPIRLSLCVNVCAVTPKNEWMQRPTGWLWRGEIGGMTTAMDSCLLGWLVSSQVGRSVDWAQSSA